MEKTKGYITTLANAISLVIECSEKKTNVSFIEVLKTINQLDISDVINEIKKIDHTFFEWMEVTNYYPESLLERWNRHKRDVDEYISYVDEQSKKIIDRYGKAPQPRYIKELVEAISVKLGQLQKCRLFGNTETTTNNLDLKNKRCKLNRMVKLGLLFKVGKEFWINPEAEIKNVAIGLDVVFGGGYCDRNDHNKYKRGATDWKSVKEYFDTNINFSVYVGRATKLQDEKEIKLLSGFIKQINI